MPTAPRTGFDLELIRLVRAAVSIPVIASGGAGAVEHFAPAVDAGADAVLAATVFHFGTLRIAEVKAALAATGHPLRLTGVPIRMKCTHMPMSGRDRCVLARR